MSRGLGNRQKAILAALRPGKALELRDLCETDNEYRALTRAARMLADAGQVRIVKGGRGLAVELCSEPSRRHDDVSPSDRALGIETVEESEAVRASEWYQRVYCGKRQSRA